MNKQFWLTICLLLLATLYLRFFTTVEAVPLAADIEGFPQQVGSFTLSGSSEFSQQVLEEVGVDSYINREYRDKEGHTLSLYLGYYEEQREGSMIHSPRHCMPGGGWVPVESSVVRVSAAGSNAPHRVNRMVFQKGMDKLVMHYWYQGRNRVVANEYVDRFYLLLDSLLHHRSEGALVRVIGTRDADSSLEKKQEQFVAELFPLLEEHLPR
jgi:EpsI family protein